MSDILERLDGYNPPDRTVDDQRQIAIDIADAAAEIKRLREVMEFYADENTYNGSKARKVLIEIKEKTDE